MQAVVVEVIAPCRHQIASMAQAVEQVLIQEFIAHSTVERFNEPVLHGSAGGDVVPRDLAIFLPFQNGVRGQLGPVTADHQVWISPHLGNPVQFAANPDT